MCIYIYIYREREREKRKKKAQPTMSSYATENYYLQFLLIMEAISTQPYVSPQLTDIIIYPLLIKGKSKKESHFCPIELERERERERERTAQAYVKQQPFFLNRTTSEPTLPTVYICSTLPQRTRSSMRSIRRPTYTGTNKTAHKKKPK
jgi:hypothetical protein